MSPTYLKKPAPLPTNETGHVTGQIDVKGIVSSVIDDVRKNGDEAVRRYSEKFDKWSPESFRLSKEQIDEIISKVPQQTIDDIKEVQSNVRAFAQKQKESLKDFEVEIRPGVHLGQKNVPIDAVGW
jgi:histidinol dehydrogenase